MIIAIISDIHDNFANLEKCLAWIKKNKILNIICCGDVTTNDTLDLLTGKFKGTINLVKGNVEIYSKNDVEKYKNINYHGRIARIKFGKINIGICHEPFMIAKVKELGDVDIIFYVHTEKYVKQERIYV